MALHWSGFHLVPHDLHHQPRPPALEGPWGGPLAALNGSSHLEIYLYPERMLEESQSLETRSLFHWIALPFLGFYSLAMDLNM